MQTKDANTSGKIMFFFFFFFFFLGGGGGGDCQIKLHSQTCVLAHVKLRFNSALRHVCFILIVLRHTRAHINHKWVDKSSMLSIGIFTPNHKTEATSVYHIRWCRSPWYFKFQSVYVFTYIYTQQHASLTAYNSISLLRDVGRPSGLG